MYILVELAAEAAQAERRAHRKAVKNQPRSENDQPPSNLVSNLLQACDTTQPWTPLSSSAAQHGLPARWRPPRRLPWCPCPLRLDDIRCVCGFERCSGSQATQGASSRRDGARPTCLRARAHVMSHGAGAHQCAAHARRSEGRRWRLKERDQRSRWHSQSEV